MSKKIGFAAISLLVALSLPAALDAQVRLGLGGGPAFPQSELGDVTDAGFHLQGSLGLEIPLLPVGARADVIWQRYPGDVEGDITSVGGMLNGTLRLPMPLVRPYLVGGIGLMHQDDVPHDGHIDLDEGGTEFAFGLGAGVRLGLIGLGLGAFVEARYLDWGHGSSAVPVTIGISF